jgi:uncharacterized protein (TIGR03435 family)
MSGSLPSIPYEQVQSMVRALLEDRFQLKWHRETRELAVYNLVVAKGGLKMRPSADQSPPDPRQASISFDSLAERSKPLARGAMRIATGSEASALVGSSVSIAALVTLLQGQADRIVFDKTNINTLFDFDLQYSNEVRTPRAQSDPAQPAPGDPAPSLFTAVQELGLNLDPAKAPLEVLVIDSVSRPTEN